MSPGRASRSYSKVGAPKELSRAENGAPHEGGPPYHPIPASRLVLWAPSTFPMPSWPTVSAEQEPSFLGIAAVTSKDASTAAVSSPARTRADRGYDPRLQ